MTPQDSAAEVEALYERLREALSADDGSLLASGLGALASLAQQLEKLREERDEARQDADKAEALHREAVGGWVYTEAEWGAALERVKMLQETLRLISDGCKLARDDLRPELARIEEVADRALGGSDV